ncbi:MAG: dihydropteroate synthase [Alphaproteobacteria bacterium]|nr:dihydropteroate synthase [Alphaproteobacteria bacterium]
MNDNSTLPVGNASLTLPYLDWHWRRCKYVMAVVNATPDSFSADGLFRDASPEPEVIAEKLLAALSSGADVLDIGAESTRPGSEPVAVAEQIARLRPVFSALAQVVAKVPEGWCVSLDTSDPVVAEWGLCQGVQIINDVYGGRDPELLKVVAQHRGEIILMHNFSQSHRLDDHEELGLSYAAEVQENIVTQVIVSLREKAIVAEEAGIARARIFLDPGIGFGKTVADNLRLIQGVDRIVALGYPVLVGASRKSFLGKILNLGSGERLESGLMVHAQALMQGAQMIRVHDVRAHHRLRRVAEALCHPEEYDHD